MRHCDQLDQKKVLVKATGWSIPNMLGSKKKSEMSSIVSEQVNVPGCVPVPWNNAFLGYHFVPHSCFPPSTDESYYPQ